MKHGYEINNLLGTIDCKQLKNYFKKKASSSSIKCFLSTYDSNCKSSIKIKSSTLQLGMREYCEF